MGLQVLKEGAQGNKNQRQRTKGELRLGPVKIVRKYVPLFFFLVVSFSHFFFFFLVIAELKNWLSASEKSAAACTTWKKCLGHSGEKFGAFFWEHRIFHGRSFCCRKNSKNIKSRQPKN